MNWFRYTLAFLEREYLSSGVNMLTNSLKILDTIKTEFFELIFFLNDQKLWQKFCHADLIIVSDPWTFWLSISVVTRCFLGIYVTRSFAVYNLWKKYSLRLIFFYKVFQILCIFWKCSKKLRKYLLILRSLHLNWLR